MKVLIHALGASMGGALRHLTNFLPELSRTDGKREYLVLIRESFPSLSVGQNIRFERIKDEICCALRKRIVNDVFNLPGRLRAEKFSAIVSLTNFGPIWSPVPHIVFQRNALLFCPNYLESIHGPMKIEILFRRWLAMASMLKASLIVTPSHAMAEMIKAACPQTRHHHFRTLRHGYDGKGPQGSQTANWSPDIFDSRPTLFFPSHLGEYKGYRLLFKVVAVLAKTLPGLRLILTIGPEDDEQLYATYTNELRQLGITKHVKMIGRVPQDQIGQLYDKADLLIYPSTCESFGFSLLEAMGAGLPIVAADTRINREICGTGASYFSPFDALDCADRVQTLLSNTIARDALRSEAARRLSTIDWSWRRYVAEFQSILEECES
jgi:glycosyltransferase involved in cell wall biosynthesis